MRRLLESAVRVKASVLSVDPPVAEEVARAALESAEAAEDAAVLLTALLGAKSSHTRLLAVRLADLLFARVPGFRAAFVRDLARVLQGTLGAPCARVEDFPPPRALVPVLRTAMLQAFASWHEAFAAQHVELQLARSYISSALKLTLPAPRARIGGAPAGAAAPSAADAASRRAAGVAAHERARSDASEVAAEARACLACIENGLALLVPDSADALFPAGAASDAGVGERLSARISAPSTASSVNLTAPPVGVARAEGAGARQDTVWLAPQFRRAAAAAPADAPAASAAASVAPLSAAGSLTREKSNVWVPEIGRAHV